MTHYNHSESMLVRHVRDFPPLQAPTLPDFTHHISMAQLTEQKPLKNSEQSTVPKGPRQPWSLFFFRLPAHVPLWSVDPPWHLPVPPWASGMPRGMFEAPPDAPLDPRTHPWCLVGPGVMFLVRFLCSDAPSLLPTPPALHGTS